MFRRSWPVLFILLVLGSFSSVASASGAAPGYKVIGRVTPTNLPPGGEGRLELVVFNVGGAGGEGATLTDTLPAGLTASTGFRLHRDDNSIQEGGEEYAGAGCTGTGTHVVSCDLGTLAVDDAVFVRIPVRVASSATGRESPGNQITVTGGGAPETASASLPVAYGSGSAGAGVEQLDSWASSADGTTDVQAGSHPFDFGVDFALNTEGSGVFGVSEYNGEQVQPAGGEIRNIVVNLPPGMVGNPTAVPRCTKPQFENDIIGCPASTQIGLDMAILAGESGPFNFPVYNLVPPPGVAAQFAFNLSGNAVYIDSRVRSGGNYGITAETNNIPQRNIVFNSLRIWGVPADRSHDARRPNEAEGCEGFCRANAASAAFLTLPTACEAPQSLSAEMRGTYQDESIRAGLTVTPPGENGLPFALGNCEVLGFEPSLTVSMDTSDSDTPAGLSAEVKTSQTGLTSPESLSSSDLRDTTVTLPQGVVINPGQAAGLVACSAAQADVGVGEALGDEAAPSCPIASKVGTDSIATPLLPDKLEGNVYVLESNPPHLQLLVAASGDGVNLKLVGEVHLNESTGQLTTTFKRTPEFPFTVFKLSFSGGAQAALVTPTTCGTYATNADFTPWSSPFVSDAPSESRFAITAGPQGTACPNGLPFSPSMIAGSTTDQAGGFTSFSLLLQRGDGQQRIGALQFKTPEGLLGMISKIPLCPEPQASEGTCSEASQIGHTVVEAGPGPYPLVVPQPGQPPAPIYLTGGYKGAPYGLSIVVPLHVGPFTLQTQVVRARIEVDPRTTQLTVTTDPLPTIIDGIPADLRAINAVIDKPGFMFNPTGCESQSFSGTATSTEGASAPISSHFQMGSCRALTFKPNFKVSTSGKTSRANGASLDAKILYPTGELGANQASSQSNVKSVKVDLPKQLPSRLTTLQKACTAATFEANPANCPTDSRVGQATAITPVLPVELTGPAYFVSYGGAKFPELVIVLQGYGVTVFLHGETFISKAGITSSTFRNIPDVPITSFELKLPQGPFSALAANGNLCTTKLAMPTAFTGQNGAVLKQSTPISVTGCPKHTLKGAGKAKKANKTHQTHARKKASKGK